MFHFFWGGGGGVSAIQKIKKHYKMDILNFPSFYKNVQRKNNIIMFGVTIAYDCKHYNGR